MCMHHDASHASFQLLIVWPWWGLHARMCHNTAIQRIINEFDGQRNYTQSLLCSEQFDPGQTSLTNYASDSLSKVCAGPLHLRQRATLVLQCWRVLLHIAPRVSCWALTMPFHYLWSNMLILRGNCRRSLRLHLDVQNAIKVTLCHLWLFVFSKPFWYDFSRCHAAVLIRAIDFRARSTLSSDFHCCETAQGQLSASRT